MDQIAIAAQPAAADLLGRARPGDGLLVASLVPAPSLHCALTPEASAVLHDSLVRIVAAAVGTASAVAPWIHDAVLALMTAASPEECRAAGAEVRARWHQKWQAPVTVVTGTATVDTTTPASVAVCLAGAQLGASKDACLHA